MKILVASSSTMTNPFVPLLIQALRAHPDVEAVHEGRQRFWEEPLDVDVVHQHWPEELFRWETPTEEHLRLLQAQFDLWKERCAVVATVHNCHPHYRDTEMTRRLFALVYENVDGFIHRGQASLDDHRARYPGLADRPHVLIPPGLDTAFDNTMAPDEARASFGIPPGEPVFLSLGKIRHLEEMHLVVDGFRAAQIPRKHLLLSTHCRGRTDLRTPWLYALGLRLDARIRLNQNYLEPGEVQRWVNAADVVIVPRMKPLNSANVSLGFSFGKVVVGPDSGVVGEVLRATGNPTFDGRDIRSVASALERAAALAADGHGRRNRLYAETHWHWRGLADQHVTFFRDVLSRSRSGAGR